MVPPWFTAALRQTVFAGQTALVL